MRAGGHATVVTGAVDVAAPGGPDRAGVYAHSAFGYTILSNQRIAGLRLGAAAHGRAIHVCLQDVPDAVRARLIDPRPPSYVSAFRAPDGNAILRAWMHPADAFVVVRSWDGTACVLDRAGDRLWLTWPETIRDPEEFLLGPALGFALRLRGDLALHATAILIGTRAVLLAGPSASGKSTIAAVLSAEGHPVVGDDVSVVRKAASGVAVEPGTRRLRLRPESISPIRRAIGRDLAWTASPGGECVDLWLEDLGAEQSSPARDVAAIYFLEPDAGAAGEAIVDEMARADALVALVSDSWATRLQDDAMRRREFESAADVVAAVRLRRLRYSQTHVDVRALADVIVGDMNRQEVTS